MYELPVGACARAGHLFDSLDHHLAVRGILEGTVTARVFADHPTFPQSVFAWTGHRLFLAGSAQNQEFNEDIRRLIATIVYPQASNVGNHMFILYYAPGDWESTIEWILDGKCPISDERLYFETKGRGADGRAPLPDGYALRWVDEALLKEERLKNIDALREEMCSERASVADFLAMSFGFCLVRADEIVGWCLSEYNTADRCEVGIATAEGHRRQGLATAMACALVERAIRKGIERIGWHCWANNLASAATALRAGFEKAADYPVFFAWFDEAENQAVNGNARLCRREYANDLPSTSRLCMVQASGAPS